MHEELLKQYFNQEGPKGDLSPEQWEAVLNYVKTRRQRNFSWSPFTWFTASRPVTDRTDDLLPSTDSQLRANPRVQSLWQRLVPTSAVGWVATGLILFATLGAVSYAISPTLGEKLFSQVMGRWGQDYKAERPHEINMTETIEGITVTVDRAYFESNRIGIEYTVTGLPQSTSEGSHEFQPQATLRDAKDPNVRFRSAGGSGVRTDSQIKGMEVSSDTVKEVVGFDVTEAETDASGMRLLFAVSIDESVRENNVLRQERMIGPFEFDFEVPFVPSKDTRVIQVGTTVEVSGVPVRLEEVTITPAELTALIRVERSPEQRQAGVHPGIVVLGMPGEWPTDSPPPWAYVVTTLGDIPDTFLARFHVYWEVKSGKWELTVENLRGTGDPAEALNGPWIFHFQVP